MPTSKECLEILMFLHDTLNIMIFIQLRKYIKSTDFSHITVGS